MNAAPIARRALLAGSAAAVCLGSGPVASSPRSDAELLRLGEQLKATIAKRNAFPDIEQWGPGADEVLDALCETATELAERMVAITPASLAGVEAKARAIDSLAVTFWDRNSVECDVIQALLNDLRALAVA